MCQMTVDLCLVGSYDGPSLTLSGIQFPMETTLCSGILGSVRAPGASYSARGLTRVEARHNDRCRFAFPRTTCSDDSSDLWLPGLAMFVKLSCGSPQYPIIRHALLAGQESRPRGEHSISSITRRR
jgi:hypothetical protein